MLVVAKNLVKLGNTSFSLAAEDYITNQLERSFKTLDFYNKVKRD